MPGSHKFDPLPATIDLLKYFTPGAVRPSPTDTRDYHVQRPRAAAIALPPRATTARTTIRNQGPKGSCMCFTGMRILENEFIRAASDLDGSEEYLYARAREIGGSLCENVGTNPREVMKLLTDYGTLTEADRPYSDDLCAGTTEDERLRARQVRAREYMQCGDLAGVKYAISQGHKVTLCMYLSDNFRPDPGTGVLPEPSGAWWGGSMDNSGHAMTIEGYDDELYGGVLLVANSWSESFGMSGSFYLPYAIFNRPPEESGAWKDDLWMLNGIAVAQPQRPLPVPEPATISRSTVLGIVNDAYWRHQRMAIGGALTVEAAGVEKLRAEGIAEVYVSLTESLPVLTPGQNGHAAVGADFADFAGTITCENGHTVPAGAGACPRCQPRAYGRRVAASAVAAPGASAVPAPVQRFIDQFVDFKDNGLAPRWNHAFGYENRKLGVVNHIPVCDTLAQLTAYFNGGDAQGSTHFGIGREQAGSLDVDGLRIPMAPVHQYMPIVGPVAPWAQGIIQTSSNCPIPPSPTIQGMLSGEPNGAFVSIENVARTGADGVTDPQFNSNVFLRAYCAAFFGHAINPLTQLWHSEIDQRDRCFDPGWDGALEDAMQDAARRVLVNDFSGLRGAIRGEPSPLPTGPLSPEWLLRVGTAATLSVATHSLLDGAQSGDRAFSSARRLAAETVAIIDQAGR